MLLVVMKLDNLLLMLYGFNQEEIDQDNSPRSGHSTSGNGSISF